MITGFCIARGLARVVSWLGCCAMSPAILPEFFPPSKETRAVPMRASVVSSLARARTRLFVMLEGGSTFEDVLRSDPARYCPVCRRARPYTASAARPSSRFSATTFGSVPLALEGLFRPLVHLAGRVFLYSLKRGIFMHFFSCRLIPIHIFTLFRGMGLMFARVCKPGRVFRGHEKLAEGKV